MLEKISKTSTAKTVGFSEPKEMEEVEPRPEEDVLEPQNTDREASKPNDSSSDSSELGDSEAFDEEEDGVMEDDD